MSAMGLETACKKCGERQNGCPKDQKVVHRRNEERKGKESTGRAPLEEHGKMDTTCICSIPIMKNHKRDLIPQNGFQEVLATKFAGGTRV